jgi:hypothetical protein
MINSLSWANLVFVDQEEPEKYKKVKKTGKWIKS